MAASGRLALLFPGQGSQTVGMGAALLESDAELYERYLGPADQVSGRPVRRHSLEGPIEALTETDVAQPALFALCLALHELARRRGLCPAFVAGHSLGEYTAAVAAGALSFENGLRLVSERGRLMAAVQSERPGAMAAVLGLDSGRVEELCREASGVGQVTPANVNAPSQIVVAGEERAVEKVTELAEAAGARKVVRLQVGAAFHTELMEPVQERIRTTLEGVALADPQLPLVSNASGRIVTTAAGVGEALVAQIASPVRWVECVEALHEAGCSMYLELGPGRVLGGLVKQILGREADVAAVDSRAQLDQLATARPELFTG